MIPNESLIANILQKELLLLFCWIYSKVLAYEHDNDIFRINSGAGQLSYFRDSWNIGSKQYSSLHTSIYTFYNFHPGDSYTRLDRVFFSQFHDI